MENEKFKDYLCDFDKQFKEYSLEAKKGIILSKILKICIDEESLYIE